MSKKVAIIFKIVKIQFPLFSQYDVTHPNQNKIFCWGL